MNHSIHHKTYELVAGRSERVHPPPTDIYTNRPYARAPPADATGVEDDESFGSVDDPILSPMNRCMSAECVDGCRS